MSNQHTSPSRSASSPNGAGVVVQRPGVVQTIGGALNQAFAPCGALPDDFAQLLQRLDAETRHFDGE